jgi:hypothetical protein
VKIATTADIRNFLIENMVKTAEGKIEVGQAKAMCNFAQQIYNTIKLEMQFATLRQADKIGKVEAVTLSGEGNGTKTRSLRAA